MQPVYTVYFYVLAFGIFNANIIIFYTEILLENYCRFTFNSFINNIFSGL